MQKWQRISPTKSHKVGWRTVVTKTFRTPNGGTSTFDTFGPEDQHHVAIIGLTNEHKVIIARHYRAGPEQIMDELPGGTVDAGEDKETAIKRELLEETGYQPGHLEYIGQTYKDAYMNATWHFFLGLNCKQVSGQKLVSEEQIEVHLISIDQLIHNARASRMTDAVAVLMAYDKLLQLKQGGLTENNRLTFWPKYG